MPTIRVELIHNNVLNVAPLPNWGKWAYKSFDLMHPTRFELARAFAHKILSLTCIPIPPRVLIVYPKGVEPSKTYGLNVVCMPSSITGT